MGAMKEVCCCRNGRRCIACAVIDGQPGTTLRGAPRPWHPEYLRLLDHNFDSAAYVYTHLGLSNSSGAVEIAAAAARMVGQFLVAQPAQRCELLSGDCVVWINEVLQGKY